MIETSLKGYNAVFICYGQTGSGKSYSLLGIGAKGREQGILQISIGSLLGRENVSLKLSAIEAYSVNNKNIPIYDLFNEVDANLDWTKKRKRTKKFRQYRKKGIRTVSRMQINVFLKRIKPVMLPQREKILNLHGGHTIYIVEIIKKINDYETQTSHSP
eukprot:UN03201